MKTQRIYFLLILLYSCGFPCVNPADKKLGNESIIAFGSMKDGSWWIYEKENSLLRDTIQLSGYYRRIESFRGKEECDDIEMITFTLTGKNIFTNKSIVKIDARTSIDVVSCSDSTSDLFNFSIYTERGKGYEKSIWLDYEILDNYELKDKEYSKVILIKYKQNVGNGIYQTETTQLRYFAPNIGLIRFENILSKFKFNKDSSIYNLVNFDVKN